ncbi:MAG: hypothetical protein ABMA64_40930 [Myxococcota bacterium]
MLYRSDTERDVADCDPGDNSTAMTAGQAAAQAATVKHALCQLSRDELQMMHLWIDEAVRVHARAHHLHVARTPSMGDQEDPQASEVEIAGWIRHRLHDLPQERLPELALWVHRRLALNRGRAA